MKNIAIIMLLFFTGFTVQAQDKKNKNAKYSIEVDGNCEQCKKRIEKAAFGVTGVKSASWSIETHQLDLILNEEKSSIAEVKQAIAKAGHDVEGFKAADTDYDKLNSCCKYDRK